MPSIPNLNTINEIVELAQSVESDAVLAVAARCVTVRNRHASCKKCVDACLADAITIKNNKISIDVGACVACGACIAVCPTSALMAVEPSDEDMDDSITKAMVETGGPAVFACARIASRRLGDVEKYVEVPCLGRMEERELVQLAARGANEIYLVDGDCSTCKYKKTNPYIDKTVESAEKLLALQGNHTPIKRQSKFPDFALEKDSYRAMALARRNAFSGTGGFAKNLAIKAAERIMEQRFGTTREQTMREKLGTTPKGKIPPFDADRNMHILDALYEIGEPTEPELDSRTFGNVSIDLEKCNGCGMCVRFCPTSALVDPEIDPESEKKPVTSAARKKKPKPTGPHYLEFSVADCVQCNLCADVCLKKCLTVSSVVNSEELFDFEPRPIEINRPGKRRSPVTSVNSTSAAKTTPKPSTSTQTKPTTSTQPKPASSTPKPTGSTQTKPASSTPKPATSTQPEPSA